MDKLTVEQWDELGEEEQAIRIDEKPEELAGKPSSDLTLESLTEDVKKLNTQLAKVEEERGGLIGDLKGERQARQAAQQTIVDLEAKIKGKKDDDPLEGLEDDDPMTIGQVRKLLVNAKQIAAADGADADEKQLRDRAVANYTTDEEAMQGKDKLAVPYDDVIKEFEKMAKTRPSLMVAVNAEARRPNGKPAELAYNLALTSKAFSNVVAKEARENLIRDLVGQGKLKPTKILGGGGGAGGPRDAANMSEEDLLNCSDAELDAMLEKTK